MDQHPIPRQITTFEFKLIGFMTLKQFLFILFFFPIGYLVYAITPIPFVNIFLGVIVAGIGLIFAFVPIQDRPFDVWLKNFFKRLNSPTQYGYKKSNPPVYFLKDLYFTSDPHMLLSHVESREKLADYLRTQQPLPNDPKMKQKGHIQDLLKQPGLLAKPKTTASAQASKTYQAQGSGTVADMQGDIHQPFLSGIIKNRKQIALPGILVSIQDKAGKQLRLLKTNPHGVFATYSPLVGGDYLFEVSDPNGNYFFDTMNVHFDPDKKQPLVFYSKELL
ncbi:MAG: PrgI family protein [Weeksellaceae bacterium]